MNSLNLKVDEYLLIGCGRCPLGGTPACKVHLWPEILQELRQILLETELTEEVKWSVPCYTWEGNNILILSAFKEYSSISFFKGALLSDPQGILDSPGSNSQAARLLKITDIQQIAQLRPLILSFIEEAIANEKAGLKIAYKSIQEWDIPTEFQHRMEEDPALKNAFEALTPGRKRGYLLHFSGAKQSQTRLSRIEKCIPKIFEGKGMQE